MGPKQLSQMNRLSSTEELGRSAHIDHPTMRRE
jgi:hypothetical protein